MVITVTAVCMFLAVIAIGIKILVDAQVKYGWEASDAFLNSLIFEIFEKNKDECKSTLFQANLERIATVKFIRISQDETRVIVQPLGAEGEHLQKAFGQYVPENFEGEEFVFDGGREELVRCLQKLSKEVSQGLKIMRISVPKLKGQQDKLR